ncbi:MAG TPA: glycosyltransferase family 4 protein [Terracidiphilus sp.]|nr:glycosyltransferase family 4 protein [Terracidiphilus sp.]
MRIFVLQFVISVLITGVLRRYLGRHGLLDLPNARSSHAVPVPRGGGLAIVVTFLPAVFWAFERHLISDRLAWALIGGGCAIAVIGFLDDRYRLAAWPRMVVHSLAAAWAIWCFSNERSTHFSAVSFGDWVGSCVAFLALVWLTNLFNFMDGIDGLAGVEAVCVSGLGAVLMLRGGSPGVAQVLLMLCAASLGFLVWNWPPAKIFMGDVGSGFLGFTLGTCALFSTANNRQFIWPWAILLAVFIVDATITLLRRILARAPWYQAHRSHAYQHAARTLGSHAKVTLLVAAINIVWLFPLAWAASRFQKIAALSAAVAAVPLLYLALRFQAGREEPAAQARVSELTHSVN